MISVKNAGDVLLPIIERHSKSNIVLKMDCEGEEYGIIEILSERGLLPRIDFVMLEWHYHGKERILSILEKEGFSYCCAEQKDMMGQLCAWR